MKRSPFMSLRTPSCGERHGLSLSFPSTYLNYRRQTFILASVIQSSLRISRTRGFSHLGWHQVELPYSWIVTCCASVIFVNWNS